MSRRLKVVCTFLLFAAGAASGQEQFDPNCGSNHLILRCSDVGPYVISNPNLILDLRDRLAIERMELEARLQLATRLGDIDLYRTAFDELNSRERIVEENSIVGQVALLALSQQNFTPFIELYQRADVAGTLTIVPYPDGTFSFQRNGQQISRPSVREIASELYNTYVTQSD